MKLILFTWLLFGCLLAAQLPCQKTEETNSLEQQTGDKQFELPKLFDFASYKRLFDKRYASLNEELARAKIFMGRALKVFISAVRYMHRRASSYLATNHMSDWTNQELSDLYRPKHKTRPNDQLDTPVADASSIRQELAKMAADGEPLAKQLLGKSTAERRRRRDTSPEVARHLTIDELIRPPAKATGKTPAQLVVPASNNPNYEPPELDSCAGSEDQETPVEPPLGSWLGNALSKLQPAAYVKSLLGSLTDARQAFTEPEVGYKAHPARESAPVMFVDHRETGCLMEPRNQGRCGSCYAFAAISLFEWIHCMDTGKLVAFSEQYLVDCGSRTQMDACAGGAIDEALDFVHNYGLELARNYPYSGRNGQCPYEPEVPKQKMGYLRFLGANSHPIERENLIEGLEISPLLVTMMVNLDFPFYAGGLDENLACSGELAHAMLLVGHGEVEGRPFYLLRNSHGPSWGHQGYWRLDSRAMNRCISDGTAMASDASFTDGRAARRLKK